MANNTKNLSKDLKLLSQKIKKDLRQTEIKEKKSLINSIKEIESKVKLTEYYQNRNFIEKTKNTNSNFLARLELFINKKIKTMNTLSEIEQYLLPIANFSNCQINFYASGVNINFSFNYDFKEKLKKQEIIFEIETYFAKLGILLETENLNTLTDLKHLFEITQTKHKVFK